MAHSQDQSTLIEPPFALRARLLSSSSDGSMIDIPDGVISCDDTGRIDWIGNAGDYGGAHAVTDMRPMVIIPGLVDTHAHLPQIPITGIFDFAGLMNWLEVSMAPAERRFSGAGCREAALTYYCAFAAAGTTTAMLYGSVDADATDAAFKAAAEHGLRVILGQCLMDRLRYDDTPEEGITERRLRESESLCQRWHGYDDGRLQYAFTPRFAPSCTPEMLRESAQMAAASDAYWQTHLAEDLEDVALALEVHDHAQDYVDIYDRAGGLTRKSVFAHGAHLSDREVARLIEAGCSMSHCPSNVFGIGGLLDLGRYLDLGIPIGLGSDVGGSTDFSLFKAVELGWVCQAARDKFVGSATVVSDLKDWFHLATLGGAASLGLADRIGSLEVSKDADLVAVDVERLRIVPGSENDDSNQLLTSMMFRHRPDMVRHAWVRGREVSGPGMFDNSAHVTDALL